jgi:hypothetical protein
LRVPGLATYRRCWPAADRQGAAVEKASRRKKNLFLKASPSYPN